MNKKSDRMEGHSIEEFNREYPDGTMIVDTSERDMNNSYRKELQIYIEGVNVETIRYDHVAGYRITFAKDENSNWLHVDLGEWEEDGDFSFTW